MIDTVLLIARLLFVALLYLFLFAIMKTGVGLVRGQRKKERSWNLSIERGPKELRGVSIAVRGPVVVGRTPGADFNAAMLNDSVLGVALGNREEEFIPEDDGPQPALPGQPVALPLSSSDMAEEDLAALDAAVNGKLIAGPVALKNNDVVNIGDVAIRVRFA